MSIGHGDIETLPWLPIENNLSMHVYFNRAYTGRRRCRQVKYVKKCHACLCPCTEIPKNMRLGRRRWDL